MDTIINVIHIVAALSLILTVLLQAGKGAAMGSGLGAGSSQTMFGSSGAGFSHQIDNGDRNFIYDYIINSRRLLDSKKI